MACARGKSLFLAFPLAIPPLPPPPPPPTARAKFSFSLQPPCDPKRLMRRREWLHHSIHVHSTTMPQKQDKKLPGVMVCRTSTDREVYPAGNEIIANKLTKMFVKLNDIVI